MNVYKLGFIGAGNMAAAIIKGAIDKTVVSAENISAFDIDVKKLSTLTDSLQINAAASLSDLCQNSDIILLCIKPNVMSAVLGELKNTIGDQSIVSIAAGWNAAMIKNIVGENIPVLRLMPNTPLMVGEGMSVFETPDTLPADQKAFIETVFMALGKVESAPVKLMDAVTAVSGSGPAYVFMFIEALADAGVLCGLPRNMAMTLASQTVLGASKMVLDSDTHPGALKDAVCSPGGTTIEAVKSLENDGFRGTVIKAVEKCANKSKALAK